MFFFLLPALLCAANALACGILSEGNRKAEAKLLEQRAALAQLQQNVSTLETQCTQRQTQLSKQGALSASAESCVTFRENAALHKKLAETSDTCSTQATTVQQQIADLKSNFILPQEEDLAGTVQIENGLPTLQLACEPALKKTHYLRAQSAVLLDESTLAITHAQKAIENYNALGAQTRKFAAQSQASLHACGSSDDASNFAILPPPATAVAHGKPVAAESTVTGNVDNSSLFVSEPGKAKGGRKSAHSESYDPSAFKGISLITSRDASAQDESGYAAGSESSVLAEFLTGTNTPAPAGKAAAKISNQLGTLTDGARTPAAKTEDTNATESAGDLSVANSSTAQGVDDSDLFQRIHGVLRPRRK